LGGGHYVVDLIHSLVGREAGVSTISVVDVDDGLGHRQVRVLNHRGVHRVGVVIILHDAVQAVGHRRRVGDHAAGVHLGLCHRVGCRVGPCLTHIQYAVIVANDISTPDQAGVRVGKAVGDLLVVQGHVAGV